MEISGIDYIYLLLPIVSGFVVGRLTGIGSEAGKSIPARPPPSAFGIVWTILYLLVGYSWFITNKKGQNLLYNNILYGILITLLCLWIIVYSKNKKHALYIIALCILSVLMIIVYHSKDNNTASLMLCPLFVWLIFAMQLNYTEVNEGQ